jgi:DNA polymerase III subunit gamma/tau
VRAVVAGASTGPTSCSERHVAYVSLYRKYRPQTFDDVVGQDHVTRTLVNAIEEGRLHHAYLFTGPRGTGKTSTARLLAKAINCEQGPTPRPCNECEQCTAIASGQSVDVIELDMASHGGVDDARDLRDRALFAPATARRKVYILDEVHMASTAAFNALLKLIEEPPEHVLFAMATTDPQKVLPTIMSRVQRLDLRRVPADDVAGNVRQLCRLEGYTIEEDAVDAIVRAGDGSLRDTQSVLEQVLAFTGESVTAAAVAQVLGTTPADRVFDAVARLADRDVAGVFALVQSLLDDGHDLRRFTLDLVQHLRDLVVLQVAPERPDLVDATDERRRRLLAQTTAMPRESLLRAVDVLADTLAEQRQGPPRLPLELALARLAVAGADGDLSELTDRVARLEQGVATVPPPTPPQPAPQPEPTPSPEPQPAPTPQPGPEPEPAPASPEPEPASPEPEPTAPEPAPAAEPDPAPAPAASEPEAAPAAPEPEPVEPAPQPEPVQQTPEPEPAQAASEPEPVASESATAAPTADDLALVERNWEGILDLVKRRSRRCHAVFEPATPVRLSRGILTLRYPRRYASFHAQNAPKGEYAETLAEAVGRACDLRVKVEAVVEGDDDRRRPQPPDVTPPDARTPVIDDDPGPSVEEETEVREAEQEVRAATPGETDELVVRELDARLVDEQPPAHGS